jgi:two-component sensor histidine kinase
LPATPSWFPLDYFPSHAVKCLEMETAPMAKSLPGNHDAARRALRSALLYALFGGLWIVFSDSALGFLVQDPDALTRLQIYKGWFFVGVTALLVWGFVRTHLQALAGANSQLLERTAQLKTALAEREVLLREVHHRVMNNLHVMAGLLNLARDKVVDTSAAPALDAAIARVYGMALIHSQLYGSERLDQVDLARFVRELYAYLAGRNAAQRVEAVFDLDEVVLHLERAVPCGMLLGEALSNVFAHAFAPGTRGRVTVRVKQRPGDRVLLAVEDNGRGLDPDRAEGLGLGIIRSLVVQPRGELALAGEGGTAVRVEFSGAPPRPRR